MDFKYNDRVRILHPFYDGAVGRVVGYENTTQRHPNRDTCVYDIIVLINDLFPRTISELYLEKLTS